MRGFGCALFWALVCLLVPQPWAMAKDAKFDAAVLGNSWRELTTPARERLSKVVTELPPWAMYNFTQWYAKYYCPEAAGIQPGQPLPAKCPKAEQFYGEYFYNNLLTLEQRVSLACLSSKLESELGANYMQTLGIRSVSYSGTSANVQFNMSRPIEEVTAELDKNPRFTSNNGAWYDREWGLRDKRVGAELHLEQPKGTKLLAAHIDFDNPGEERGIQSVVHYVEDQTYRKENYTPDAILFTQPDACGVGYSDLTEVAGRTGLKFGQFVDMSLAIRCLQMTRRGDW